MINPIAKKRQQWVEAHIAAQSTDHRWEAYSKHLNASIPDTTNKAMLIWLLVMVVSIPAGVLSIWALIPFGLLLIAIPILDIFVSPYIEERLSTIAEADKKRLVEAFQDWATERYEVEVPNDIAEKMALDSHYHISTEVFEFEGSHYAVKHKNCKVFIGEPTDAELLVYKTLFEKKRRTQASIEEEERKRDGELPLFPSSSEVIV